MFKTNTATIFKTVLFDRVMDEYNPLQCQEEVQDEDDDEGGPRWWNGKVCERMIVDC